MREIGYDEEECNSLEIHITELNERIKELENQNEELIECLNECIKFEEYDYESFRDFVIKNKSVKLLEKIKQKPIEEILKGVK